MAASLIPHLYFYLLTVVRISCSTEQPNCDILSRCARHTLYVHNIFILRGKNSFSSLAVQFLAAVLSAENLDEMQPRQFIPICPVSILGRAVMTPYGAGESFLNKKHSGTKKLVPTCLYSNFQPCSLYILNMANINANVRILLQESLEICNCEIFFNVDH